MERMQRLKDLLGSDNLLDELEQHLPDDEMMEAITRIEQDYLEEDADIQDVDFDNVS